MNLLSNLKIKEIILTTVVIFLAIAAVTISVGAEIFNSINSYVVEYLKDLPGSTPIIDNLHQLFYRKLVLLSVVSLGISILAALKVVSINSPKKSI